MYLKIEERLLLLVFGPKDVTGILLVKSTTIAWNIKIIFLLNRITNLNSKDQWWKSLFIGFDTTLANCGNVNFYTSLFVHNAKVVFYCWAELRKAQGYCTSY